MHVGDVPLRPGSKAERVEALLDESGLKMGWAALL
jgi:hypothetical protein